jgi:hypothetical protein
MSTPKPSRPKGRRLPSRGHRAQQVADASFAEPPVRDEPDQAVETLARQGEWFDPIYAVDVLKTGPFRAVDAEPVSPPGVPGLHNLASDSARYIEIFPTGMAFELKVTLTQAVPRATTVQAARTHAVSLRELEACYLAGTAVGFVQNNTSGRRRAVYASATRAPLEWTLDLTQPTWDGIPARAPFYVNSCALQPGESTSLWMSDSPTTTLPLTLADGRRLRRYEMDETFTTWVVAIPPARHASPILLYHFCWRSVVRATFSDTGELEIERDSISCIDAQGEGGGASAPLLQQPLEDGTQAIESVIDLAC